MDDLPTLDLILTPKCKVIPCEWCITEGRGSERMPLQAETETRPVDWDLLLENCIKAGFFQVLLTGGEPMLLGNDLFRLIEIARDQGLRTTLSTGIYPTKGNPIVELMQGSNLIEIGLPLDGPNAEIVGHMRGKAEQQSFQRNIESLMFLEEVGLLNRVTLRTLVAKPNFSDILQIPKTLLNAGVNLSKLRWKLYQINPLGVDPNQYDKWLLSTAEFLALMSELRNVKGFGEIVSLPVFASNQRHLLISPWGEASAVVTNGDLIGDIPKMMYLRLGNVNSENLDIIHKRFLDLDF